MVELAVPLCMHTNKSTVQYGIVEIAI
jgi:hypothetical protein